MEKVMEDAPDVPSKKWITHTVLAIIIATFFSDVSHEMCTAVLPMYLATVGLGPAALGLIEGVADFLVSISKLAGGFVGHHVERKRPWASLGYLVTTLGTWGIAFVGSLAAVLTLRSAAWVGRGFRSPLRDFMLADAVEPKFYGRAYGLERGGDMLGAVVGPLVAVLLLWGGVEGKGRGSGVASQRAEKPRIWDTGMWQRRGRHGFQPVRRPAARSRLYDTCLRHRCRIGRSWCLLDAVADSATELIQ